MKNIRKLWLWLVGILTFATLTFLIVRTGPLTESNGNIVWLYLGILFWAGVVAILGIAAINTWQFISAMGNNGRRSTIDELKDQVMGEWRHWPHQSIPPTPTEIRAFYDWLLKAHPEMLSFRSTRVGWHEIQQWCIPAGA